MVQEVEKKEEGGGEGERWRQNVSSLSVLCVAVLVGLPLWWKTTEVYRSPLPYSDIEGLSGQQVPPSLLYTISLLVLSDDGKAALHSDLQQELKNQTVRMGKSEMTISYLVQPLSVEPELREKISEAVNSAGVPDLSSLLPSSAPGHYYLLVATGDKPRPSRVTISASRWAIIHTTASDQVTVEEVVEVVEVMVGGRQGVRERLEVGHEGERDAEKMRQVRAASGYQVGLTLLVPDPAHSAVDWNIEEATDRVLLPFLSHPGISRLANFTISSQVFHYTDLKLSPQKSRSGGGYHVSSANLPPFISSVESKLGSLVSQLPSLNLLVLVAPPTHCPLLIRDPRGQLTDTFLVPQWGGVLIFSPPQGGGREVMVPMEEVMGVFVKQLQLLFGVPQTPPRPGVVLEPGIAGMTEWELDQLMVSRMVESVSTATTALISLVELLDKVKNMVISDVIRKEVESALSHLHQCYSLAGEGDLEKAFAYAQRAMVSADNAFFDPSILELLYFPDDQKFAIYIPLFLPISIPILLSSLTALRWVTSHTHHKHPNT